MDSRQYMMDMQNDLQYQPPVNQYQPPVYSKNVSSHKLKKSKNQKRVGMVVKNDTKAKEAKEARPPTYSNVNLESGAVAKVPNLDSERGLFDLGKWPTIFIYTMLFLLLIMSFITLVILAFSLSNKVSNIPSTTNSTTKFFGVCLATTVFVSSSLLLGFFVLVKLRERGSCGQCWPPKKPKDDNDDKAVLRNSSPFKPEYHDYSVPVSPSQLQMENHKKNRYLR